ncbi:hypothetical protein FB451DRAFT_1439638 [Mycena latifolia]|nr:hypothetical protein FB451DRAFT_1439638 [Mycena latifolia]
MAVGLRKPVPIQAPLPHSQTTQASHSIAQSPTRPPRCRAWGLRYRGPNQQCRPHVAQPTPPTTIPSVSFSRCRSNVSSVRPLPSNLTRTLGPGSAAPAASRVVRFVIIPVAHGQKRTPLAAPRGPAHRSPLMPASIRRIGIPLPAAQLRGGMRLPAERDRRRHGERTLPAALPASPRELTCLASCACTARRHPYSAHAPWGGL